ncbi:hypothetical protein Tco_1460925, partial [Tanacetum coccineum]
DSNNDHDFRSEGSDQERDSSDDKSQSDIEKGSDSEHETDENESGFESDQDENEEDIGDDEEEMKDEFVKTPSKDSDNEDETKITDKAEGDEDEEMDYTTSQLYNDVDIKLNEPVDTDKGFAQEEGIDAAMINVQQGNENLEILQVKTLVDDHLDARLGATRDEFMNHLSASITARVTKQVKIQLPQILPKKVSKFASPVIQSMVTESLEHVVLAKESSQPQSSYEAAATLTEFELKKILLSSPHMVVYSLKRSRKDKDKDEDPSTGSDRGLKKRQTSKDVEPTKGPKAKESHSSSSKGDNSQHKSSGKFIQSEEPEFEVADSDMP